MASETTGATELRLRAAVESSPSALELGKAVRDVLRGARAAS
jgi:hypothetical protein